MQQVTHSAPVDYQMRFIDQPIVSITLQTVQKMFTKGTDLTTKGEFTGAIHAFRQCLQCVPILVISSEQAQKDLQALIQRLVEYITAMRIELERKKLVAAGS